MKKEIRNLLVVNESYGVLNIPLEFIEALGYHKGQELYIIIANDVLIVVDEENYYKIDVTKDMRIYRTKLTLNDNLGKGSHRLIINSKLVKLFKLEKNNTVAIELDSDKLLIYKYVEVQRPMPEGENTKQKTKKRKKVRNLRPVS